MRLRFVLVLVASGFVVGGWETLRTYWDRWVAPAGRDVALGSVSGDTEYFCPMDPGVLAIRPAKCPVCNMELVRRAKGDMSPLPSGVVARVALAPGRVQIGGVKTAAIGFRKLERTIELVGRFEDRDGRPAFVAPLDGVDPSWLTTGLAAEIASDPPDGREPMAGLLEALGERAIVMLSEGVPPPTTGIRARARFRVPIADREPFRSLPDDVPPPRPKEPRSLWLCHEHADVVRTESGPCPKDGNALMPRPLAADQRVRWWCPMHPKVTADVAGAECRECGGMKLVPRVVTYRPKGQVLAVPESSVIDTGERRVVYVESMPGTFDGVEVALGPRCGAWYPVVSGLEPGMRVAASGAFLIDAETRLNPALAAGYFGASRPPTEDEPAKAKSPLDGLSPTDRAMAEAQKTCPVTRKKLGSMGTPVKVWLGPRSAFVCCEGCIEALRSNPDKYLGAPEAHHP